MSQEQTNLPSVSTNLADASMKDLIQATEVNHDNIDKIKVIDDLDEYLKKFDYCPIGNSNLQNYKITDNLTPERSYRDTLVNLHGTIQAIKEYETSDKERKLDIRKYNIKKNQLLKKIEKETDDDEKSLLSIEIERLDLKINKIEDARKMSYPVLKDALERALFFKLRAEQLEKQGLRDFEESELEYQRKKVIQDARIEQVSRILGINNVGIVEMADRYSADLRQALPGDAVKFLANPEFKADPKQDPKMQQIAEVVLDHVRPGIMVAIPKREDDKKLATDIHNGLYFPFSKKPAFEFVFGENIEVARNMLVQRAILMDAEYLLFIDEDIVLSRDAILKLYDAQADVISGCYFQKFHRPLIPVFQNRKPDGTHYVPNIDGDRVIDLNWMSGCGILLIKTDVFKKIKPPYFQMLRNNQGGIAVGEDCFFIQKCVEAGLSVKLHTGVKCGHVDFKTNEVFEYYEPTTTVFGITKAEQDKALFNEIKDYTPSYKNYEVYVLDDDGREDKETDVVAFNKFVMQAKSELFIYVKNHAKLERDFILTMVEKFRRTFLDKAGVVIDKANNAMLFSKSMWSMLNDNLLNEQYETLSYAIEEFKIASNKLGRLVETDNMYLGLSKDITTNEHDQNLLESRRRYLEREFETKGTFSEYFPKK